MNNKINLYGLLGLFLILSISVSGCFENNKAESIDYSLYLNKVWGVENWDYESYHYAPSFYITKMEDGLIEGEYSKHKTIPHNYRAEDDINTIPTLVGQYNKKCEIKTEKGGGTIEFVFIDKDTIETTITLDEVDVDNNKFPSGKYVFRPYNLSDYDNLLEVNSFKTEFPRWGNVNFVTAVFSTTKSTPVAYLTNEYDDILYQFVHFHTGSKIIDVSIEDINDDGLNDIIITTDFGIVWFFMQLDNGLFILDKAESNIDD